MNQENDAEIQGERNWPLIFSEPTLRSIRITIEDTNRLDHEFEFMRICFNPKRARPRIRSWQCIAAAATCATLVSLNAQEAVDPRAIELIKKEATEHSQVMDVVSWLCDVYGPRLTGTPASRTACDWAMARLQSWGITNSHLERWTPYNSGIMGEKWEVSDRGWTTEKFAFRAISPGPFAIHAVPSVWSIGTEGRITGPAILFDVSSFDEMKQHSGKLRGAFLLMDSPLATPAHFEPEARRLTEAELEEMATRTVTGRREPTREMLENRSRYDPVQDPAARGWMLNEGVAALLYTAPGDGGNIVLAGRGGGWRNRDVPNQLPSIKVSAESYGRIDRILRKNIPVRLELEMQNTFHDDAAAYNVLADIPGVDPRVSNEIVLLGAHLDSWTFGTGATDNAAGCAVMMEAMRILKTLEFRPRRTIRIALWTGHEQGGLGAKAYVQQHLGDWVRYRRDPTGIKPAHASFSAYFNLDNGTGRIRGIRLYGNTAAGPILQNWMNAFNDPAVVTIAPFMRGGGGDQQPFDNIGLPSFSFIQDPIEYNTRTHHSSVDVYERVQPEDLKFNAAVVASFAWQAAQRDEKLPRITSGENE